MAEGKIVEHWANWDDLGLIQHSALCGPDAASAPIWRLSVGV
jgi:hypothetical protein